MTWMTETTQMCLMLHVTLLSLKMNRMSAKQNKPFIKKPTKNKNAGPANKAVVNLSYKYANIHIICSLTRSTC